MKKLLISFILTIFLSLKAYSMPKTGWINNHTFRVKTIGYCELTQSNEILIKRKSLENAIMLAQLKLIEELGKASITGIKGDVSILKNDENVVKIIKGFIKRGYVYKSYYNLKNNSCTLFYEVKGKDLNKKLIKKLENYNKTKNLSNKNT